MTMYTQLHVSAYLGHLQVVSYNVEGEVIRNNLKMA